jgi:anaerobic magnesium-protoporphyrin IX monomethyl ester cyclase
MCSYNAPNMLLPPHELIALGGILRSYEQCTAYLIDAIAEQLTTKATIQKLTSLHPDVIISIQGFECFEEDIQSLIALKTQIPTAKIVLFGYYATLFAEEILQKTNIDLVILGEPDKIFGDLMEAFLNKVELSDVMGIAYKTDTTIIIQKGDERIIHPELLPMPAYDLLDATRYFEPFLEAPFGLIQSARGCPYSCNYCVRSFGKRLTYRTTEQIIQEIIFLKENLGIKSLRFIDDTFTVHAKRVIDICKRLIDLKMDIGWTCLSRVDTLTDEMIPWMKKAGCKRIYFGIESGSEKVLRYLNKNVNLSTALSALHKCKENGIETLGFFIVGAPVETEDDFHASVNFAIEADFDYITVSELIPYPGTEFYESVKDQINFTLFPYKNEWKDASLKERNKAREKEFYKRFYYRKKYFLKSATKVLSHPIEYLDNFRKLSSFLVANKDNSRADYM